MLYPGLVSKTFQHKSIEEVLILCQKAGLKGIEWSENAHISADDSEAAVALRQKTEAAGIHVAGYGSYFRLGTEEDPAAAFARSLCSAEALHAPYIRIWAGRKPSAEVSTDERKKLAEEARMVTEMASAKGIITALEWHRNTLTDTNASAMRLLDETDHTDLRCLWQPTCALSVEERCAGIDLLEARGILMNLHVYYWPQQNLRRPLREGIDYWQTYLRHVHTDEDRYALLEFVMDDSEEQFLEDADILQKLIHHRETAGI